MADSNAGWYPASGGTFKAITHEPQRYHRQTDTSRRRQRTDRDEREGVGDRPIPAVAEPRSRSLDIEERSVYTPHSSIHIGGAEVGSDRTIKIRADATGAATAEIKLYNVDVRTWANITQQDDISVQLGWNGSESPTVFTGTVITKRRDWRNGDAEFVIRAIANGGQTVKRDDYSRTFNDLPPHRIIEYVIDDIGLGRGYISTRSTMIEGYYSLSRHKTIKEWLNSLSQEAAKRTGLDWVWYIENGDLYFHPTVERTTEPITLSGEKSLIRATPIGTPRDGNNHSYEIVTRCEPVVRRGLAVNLADIADVAEGRNYRVKSYMFESSTVTGKHYTTASITPLIERAEVYNDR